MKRKCVWCDWEGTTYQLKKHIKEVHSKTFLDYVLKINGFDHIPKCPYCGDDRSVPLNKLIVRATCGRKSCSMKYSAEIGTNPFNSENRKYDERGRDIISLRGSLAQLNNGTHPFQQDDIHKKSAHSQNSIKNRNSTIYLVSFNDIGKCKVGRTRNLQFRLETFREGGLVPTLIKAVELKEIEAHELEKEIRGEFRKYLSPLDLNKYPNKGYFRLGHSEFYDISVLNELSLYIGD